jgi:hypothetical protein
MHEGYVLVRGRGESDQFSQRILGCYRKRVDHRTKPILIEVVMIVIDCYACRVRHVNEIACSSSENKNHIPYILLIHFGGDSGIIITR